MTLHNEHGFGSTRWPSRRGRLTSSARGKSQPGRSPVRWFGLPRTERAGWVRLEVKYTGGSECWYIVKARGRSGRMPGHAYLHDVMDEIAQLR